jgi:hypothetical protein
MIETLGVDVALPFYPAKQVARIGLAFSASEQP